MMRRGGAGVGLPRRGTAAGGRARGAAPGPPRRPSCTALTVRLHRPDGAAADTSHHRVGFRTVEIVGRDLLVNGERVFIRGVNRHDFHPLTGRTVTPAEMRVDLETIKRFGFNAVRTSHYPNDPRSSTSPMNSASTWWTRRTSRAMTTPMGSPTIRATWPPSPTGSRAWCSGTRTTRASSSGRWATRATTAPTTTRPPDGCAATTRPVHSSTRARPRPAGHRRMSQATSSARCMPRWTRSSRTPRSGGGPTAHPVRVLARHGQQQRHPRRPLGRHRGHPGPPGRVHLGVLGPRPAPAHTGRTAGRPAGGRRGRVRPRGGRRGLPLGVRRRLRRQPNDGAFCADGWSSPTAPRNPPCTNTANSPRPCGCRARPDGIGAPRQRAALPRPVLADRRVAAVPGGRGHPTAPAALPARSLRGIGAPRPATRAGGRLPAERRGMADAAGHRGRRRALGATRHRGVPPAGPAPRGPAPVRDRVRPGHRPASLGR